MHKEVFAVRLSLRIIAVLLNQLNTDITKYLQAIRHFETFVILILHSNIRILIKLGT